MKMLRGVVLMGCVLGAGGSGIAFAQGGAGEYFNNWPAGVAPQEVGKKVAEHFVVSPHQYLSSPKSTIHYSEVATWYGALTFAKLTKDDALRDKLVARYEPLKPGGVDESRIPMQHHVDYSIFGIVPMERPLRTGSGRIRSQMVSARRHGTGSMTCICW
jgi:hypothetical protein